MSSSGSQIGDNSTIGAAVDAWVNMQRGTIDGIAPLDGDAQVPDGYLPATLVRVTEKGAPSGVAPLDPDSNVPQDNLPDHLTPAALSAAIAGPRRFRSMNYDTLDDLFAARNAEAGPAIIEIAPGNYTMGSVSIDHSDTVVLAYGATITAAANLPTHLVTIPVGVMRPHWYGGYLLGNDTNQVNDVDVIHLADKETTGLETTQGRFWDLHIDNAKRDLVYVGRRRIGNQFFSPWLRYAGRNGLFLGSSDNWVYAANIGWCENNLHIDAWTNHIYGGDYFNANATGAGIRISAEGVFCKLISPFIDNNFGTGLWIEGGTSAQSMNLDVTAAKFQKNSLTAHGTKPDIYIKNAQNIYLNGCNSGVQDSVTGATSYAIQTDTGVLAVYDIGSRWNPLAHATGIYSDHTAIDNLGGGGRTRWRGDGVLLWGDGTTFDVNLYRTAADVLRTDDYFRALRLGYHGTGGSGFLSEQLQSSSPTAPSDANEIRSWLVSVSGPRLARRYINSAGGVHLTFIEKAVSTAGRPSAALMPGENLFDTTLGKPIWSNGAAWVDATGAVV